MIQKMKYEEVEKINPFFSIWLSTRKTVRYALDHKDLKYSLTLGAIAGVSSAISGSKSFDFSIGFLLVYIIVLGPIFGLVGLGIGAAIFTWVGKWFGGYGTFKEMAKAMGVWMIPAIWMTPFWILSLVFVRNNLFIINLWDINSSALIWFLVSNFITITYSIWMIVIQSKGIGEVHQFSNWKGFATVIIPSFLIGIIVFFIIMIFAFTFGSSTY